MATFAEFDTEKDVFQSSDLSRHPKLVFAAAEIHPIAVSRRDGEDLVLMTKAEAHAREHLLGFAARYIIRRMQEDHAPADQLVIIYPWMYALTPEDRATCADQILKAYSASSAMGQSRLFDLEVSAWRETATAVAAGLGQEEVEWLDPGVRVERP
jgi:hypothetical protein